MSALAETSKWEDTINQIEVTDPALGGENGPINIAPRQLANRTKYLKDRTDSAQNEINTARGGKSSLNERISGLEKTTVQGDFNFNGMTGVTVAHSLGNTAYTVNVVATAATNGDLGDVYVARTANTFTVYNTGGYSGQARYQVMN